MADDLTMESASDRLTLAKTAGNEYVEQLDTIRSELTVDTGATLGTMVEAQLKMTGVETEYMVKSGLPKKVTSTLNQAAQEIKKASG